MMNARSSTWIIVGVLATLAAGCGRPAGQAPVSPAPTATQAPVSILTPAPSPAAAPTMAAPPATPAAVPVSDVQVESSASSQVLAGINIPVAVRFTLTGDAPRQVEVGLSWRASTGPGGDGDFRPYNAAPGANVAANLAWKVPPVPAGSRVEVLGVVRANGTTLTSARGIEFTVLADPGAQPPAGAQPAPAATSAVPAPPGPPQPTEDAGAASVRAELEEQGLRVRYVMYTGAEGSRPATLVAIVDATYTQPSTGAVLNLANSLWLTMLMRYPVEPGAAAATFFGAGQQWTKYVIALYARVDRLIALREVYRQNPTEEQGREAIGAFLETIVVRVYDLERQQFVDEKDFISKNFVGQ